jgi:glutamate racemase
MTTTSLHKEKNILIFDSGVGGLSLVGHIRNKLPRVNITYLADNAQFPYGLLNEDELINRATKLICQLCDQQQPDLVVVGCNSASTLVLPHLRKRLSIPVVGVVPAIKPAAQHSQTKVIGLLATPGTIQRDYTDELINEFAEGCDVIRVGSSSLVETIENTLRGIHSDDSVYRKIANDFIQHPKSSQLDTVVLACTHFPHALEELKQALPSVKSWIDSGEAIARRVEDLLVGDTAKKHNTAQPHSNIAYFTSPAVVSSAQQQSFNSFGFTHIQHWQYD